MSEFRSYHQFIYDVFLQRKKKNPAYSLRAFARDLAIPASRVSEIINGKVGISESRAVYIAKKLHFSDEEKVLFLDVLQRQYGRSAIIRERANERIQTRRIEKNTIEQDHFTLIADWYHFVLLELINIKSVSHEAEIFAQKIGITVRETKDALERLVRLGFLQFEEGRYRAIQSESTTTNDIPSAAIRLFHRQILIKAEAALEKHNISERDYSAIIFSCDKKDIPEIKERIRQFRRQLSQDYQQTETANSVYCMAMQFFEVTEKI